MHVVLTGGTGYIGRHLVPVLLRRGDTCTVVSRTAPGPWNDERVKVVVGDPKESGPWQETIVAADAVINLVGARLVEPPKRWTGARKQVLRSSRVRSTENVARAIQDAARPPTVLISGSGVSYYGARGDDVVDESGAPGNDFLARLAVDWERAAMSAADRTRVAVIRTGPVVGRHSPFLAPMIPFFKLGLGASWGDGRGWISWIHVADQVGLMLHLLDHASAAGPFNLVAPQPVQVDPFVRALARVLNRPMRLRVPELVFRMALGEAADALFKLQRAVPTRAHEAGYAFHYPDIEGALGAVF